MNARWSPLLRFKPEASFCNSAQSACRVLPDCMSRAVRLLILVVFAVSTIRCSPHATAQYKTQMPQPPRGVVSGNVQSVSNGVLVIVSNQPAFGLAQGTQVSFVLNSGSMIFDGTKGQRMSIPEIQNYRQAKVQYAVNGNRRVAIHIRLYEPVHAAAPQPPPILLADEHVRRGLALYKRGDLEGAIAEYRMAIRIAPEYSSGAHINLGNALDQEDKVDEAIQEYRSAIRQRPTYALAHYNLSLTLKRKGDRKGAAEEYDLACQFDPDSYCPQEPEIAGSRIGTFHPAPTKPEGTYFDRNGRQWDSKRDFDRICNVPSIASSSMPSTCPH
jgi:hypothetical protein